jgi:hypothetical protein
MEADRLLAYMPTMKDLAKAVALLTQLPSDSPWTPKAGRHINRFLRICLVRLPEEVDERVGLGVREDHIDWTYISILDGIHPAVLGMLREPIR